MQLHIQSPELTWDEVKRRRNLQEHGIDFRDLATFFDSYVLTQEDDRAAYGEQRFQSLGMLGGECVYVAWTLRDLDETPHIISARRANKHETQAWYEIFARYS